MSVQELDGVLPSPELGRQGRRRRQPASAAVLRFTYVVAECVRALAAAWAVEQRRRAATRQLHLLDDRALADIGLTRGAIEFVVRSSQLDRR